MHSKLQTISLIWRATTRPFFKRVTSYTVSFFNRTNQSRCVVGRASRLVRRSLGEGGRARVIYLIAGLICLTEFFTSSFAGGVEDRGSYMFETVMVEMADGVSLSTDIYRPKAGEKFPTVLIRTPYNKAHPLGKTLGESLTAQGLAVVVQDCRGCCASEGEFYAFKYERSDGLDTLRWLRAQPWHNGKIGGALGSYNSYTQLAIADELDVVLDVVSCANMYALIYPGGLYSLETVHNWGFAMDSQKVGGVTPEVVKESYSTLPLGEASAKAYGKKNLFVDDWLKHEKYDAFWQKQDHKTISKATTFSFAGWYDIFLMGQIADFEALPPNVKSRSRLVIGPWAHGQHEIENDFGGAAGEFEQLSLKLLVASLKGNDPAELFTAPLRDAQYNFFIMERNEYFSSDTWPPRETKATDYYLTGQGGLSTSVPTNGGSLEYVYDPANPYPSKGGTTLGTPAGQADQSANTNRTDQLVFNLPIGEGPLTLLGPINARLFVETDAPGTDFFVLLQDVFPDGKVVNIQEGGAEYIPGEEKVGHLGFSVWATGYQFNPGHTLRVVVTSSWFPRFNRNLNTGEPTLSAKEIRNANQRLHFGKDHPSAIILPVLGGKGK